MISRAAAIVAFLLLGACATTQAPSALPQLDSIPASFEMSGRIAIRQGQRSDIARLRWTHAPRGDLWVISTPIGNEVARIESDDSGAKLALADGGTAAAASFPELTERILGVALDPVALASWLHGGSRDETPTDWAVAIEETQKAGAIDLARRLRATRGDVVVRLVVDEYRAGKD